VRDLLSPLLCLLTSYFIIFIVLRLYSLHNVLHCLVGTQFADKWNSKRADIQAWMSKSLRPETQRKYAGKEQPWHNFLRTYDLLAYVLAHGYESAEFRRILIWFLYYLAVDLKYCIRNTLNYPNCIYVNLM